MGHDSEAYNVITAHNTPAQTKAAELAQQGVVRDLYQSASRSQARAYEALTEQADGYVPVLTSISPTTKVAGSAAFNLIVYGSNFNEDSKIYWGSTELTTNYTNPGERWAVVTAPLIAAAATVQVTLKTDGSVSNAKPFTIT